MDLNLLTVLDALLDDGSVTGAAERLHLTVPAASRALGRIRRALDDPILVRAGREMVPTPRAIALRPRVRALVDEIDALLAESDGFDPARLDRVFAIRAGDASLPMFAGALLERARAEAPAVRVRFLPEGDEDPADLRTGAVDLDVGVIAHDAADVAIEPLFGMHQVGVVRRGHPLAGGRVTARRFAAAEHVVQSRRGRLSGPIDRWLADEGLTRRVVAAVGTVGSAVLLVADSDLVTTMAAATARRWAQVVDLHVFDLPIAREPLQLALAWHRRFDADPAHAWLRALVREAMDAGLDARRPRRRTS